MEAADEHENHELIFKLLAGDGKTDRLLLATKLLNQRIKDVIHARERARERVREANIFPTRADREHEALARA